MLKALVIEASPLHLKLEVEGLGEVNVPAKDRIKVNDHGVFVVRPEQVRIDSQTAGINAGFQLNGKIKDFLYIGDVTTYIIELTNSTQIEALLPNSLPGHTKPFEVGDTVAVSWQEQSAQFFLD